MNNSLKTWFGEVTTGHGFMVIGGTLLSVLSGATTWSGAAPLLLAGAVGLVWPENAAAQTAAQTTGTDLANMIAAITNKDTPKDAPGSKPPV